jgi:hypothetical protein
LPKSLCLVEKYRRDKQDKSYGIFDPAEWRVHRPCDQCEANRAYGQRKYNLMMPAVQRESDYRCPGRGYNDRRLEMNINPIFDWFV